MFFQSGLTTLGSHGKHLTCQATVKDSHVVIHELLRATPVQQAMTF